MEIKNTTLADGPALVPALSASLNTVFRVGTWACSFLDLSVHQMFPLRKCLSSIETKPSYLKGNYF